MGMPISDVSMALYDIQRNDQVNIVGQRKRKGAADEKTEKAKVRKTDASNSSVCSWDVENVLAKREGLDVRVACSLVTLFSGDATIPFIARYRRQQAGELEPNRLREVKDTYDELLEVKGKAEKVETSLDKKGVLTDGLKTAVASATTLDELDMIWAPHKAPRTTLAGRARAAGLEPVALSLLDGSCSGVKADDEAGVGHIISDIISKDERVISRIQDILRGKAATLVSKRREEKKKKGEQEEKRSAKPQQQTKKSADNPDTYRDYFNFSRSILNIEPHNMLAINRGEEKKILTVKITLPDHVERSVVSHCSNLFIPIRMRWSKTPDVVREAIKDAWRRLLSPFICRSYRADLWRCAERAAVRVFTTNLQSLLLQAPLPGRPVMAIDPGYVNGCKVAVVGGRGEVLATEVLYLHPPNGQHPRLVETRLRSLLVQHHCEIIGVGDGVASRETENYISRLVKSKAFHPLAVRWVLVDESGVSIYSVSDTASKDLPDLQPPLRSAVSLARRLQDPLGEYARVDPQHVGVGMYQHDVSTKRLGAAANQILEQCISDVGADVNLAPEHVLTRVAGVKPAQARAMVRRREEKGAFVNREELLEVTGLGPKTFQQCAGFLRISQAGMVANVSQSSVSSTCQTGTRTESASDKPVKKKKKKEAEPVPNYLDQTTVHPESYEVAAKLITNCGCSLYQIGTAPCISSLKKCVSQTGLATLAQLLEVSASTLDQIINALQQPLNHDIRLASTNQPFFRSASLSVSQLKSGEVMRGRVKNVVDFGAFVDIGVGMDGLLHKSRVPRGKVMCVGASVEVRVEKVERSGNKDKIALAYVRDL